MNAPSNPTNAQTVQSWAKKILRKAKRGVLEADYRSFTLLQRLAFGDSQEDFLVFSLVDRSSNTTTFGAWSPGDPLEVHTSYSLFRPTPEGLRETALSVKKGYLHRLGIRVLGIRCGDLGYTKLLQQPVLDRGRLLWRDSRCATARNPLPLATESWGRIRDFEARIEAAVSPKAKARLGRKLKRASDSFVLGRLKVPVAGHTEKPDTRQTTTPALGPVLSRVGALVAPTRPPG